MSYEWTAKDIPGGDPTIIVPHLLQLEVRKWAVRNRITEEVMALLDTAEWSVVQDHMLRYFTVELKGKLLSDRLPPERVVESTTVRWREPESWWHHLRATVRWVGWLTAWRPLRYTTHTQTMTLVVDLRRFRNYPEATYPIPPGLGHMRLDYEVESRLTSRPDELD